MWGCSSVLHSLPLSWLWLQPCWVLAHFRPLWSCDPLLGLHLAEAAAYFPLQDYHKNIWKGLTRRKNREKCGVLSTLLRGLHTPSHNQSVHQLLPTPEQRKRKTETLIGLTKTAPAHHVHPLHWAPPGPIWTILSPLDALCLPSLPLSQGPSCSWQELPCSPLSAFPSCWCLCPSAKVVSASLSVSSHPSSPGYKSPSIRGTLLLFLTWLFLLQNKAKIHRL